MNVAHRMARPLSDPRRLTRMALLIFAGALANCSGTPAEPDSEAVAADAYIPAPKYAEQDGDLFMYVGQVSEEAEARGESNPVVLYRYHGHEAGVYRLETVADDGSSLDFVECSFPCRVAKTTSLSGNITRDAVQPGTILYSAFEDAANGLLTLASASAPSAVAREPTAPPLASSVRIPPADWRGQRGRCFLVVGKNEVISGDCWIRMEGQGSFQIMSPDEQYFAQLSRSGKSGFGYWNETPGSTHAQTPLGQMERSGGCWKNDAAQICAWESQ